MRLELKLNATSTNYNSQILMAGDVVSIHENFLTASTFLLDEIANPFVGDYGLYSVGMGC